MARPRRTINPDGTLFCTRGEHWVHITEFYQQSGAFVCITDPETGVDHWYGKPNSWCSDCESANRKEKHLAALELERKLLEEGPQEDEEYKDLSVPPAPEGPPVRLGPPSQEPKKKVQPRLATDDDGIDYTVFGSAYKGDK
jgi:hypothetical protein